MTYRKKLIEVALPLEAINAESAREKSIRHGHPSTLHLWWARRPLAACRAVLWASLVDDPSSWPDKFPTEEEQEIERQRLFDILARFETLTDKKGNTKQVVKGLVSWDDIKEPAIIIEAQKEIARCLAWERGEKPPVKPDKVREYITKYAPPVYDPFAGGGSIPLEAQRLGLEAHASDLNPVAVLINKALIEIPPKFRDQPPVNPVDRQRSNIESWKGAQGLAADVRYYGQWMRNEAFEKIGHLYPKVNIPSEHGEEEATVIAWIWARTVKCANPGCGCQMPLVSKFDLSTKKGKEVWIEPIVDRSVKIPVISFEVKTGKGKAPVGTVDRKGAKCLACQTPVPFDHLRNEGQAGRMDQQLIAIVAEGKNERVYLSPTDEQEKLALSVEPKWKPDTNLPEQALGFRVQNYGIIKHADLFTNRQLVSLTTFSDLVSKARDKVIQDAILAGLPNDNIPLNSRGNGAVACGNAISTYLAFGVNRLADRSSNICGWDTGYVKVRNTFARQAIPMTWDFCEANPMSDSTGNFNSAIEWIVKVVENSSCNSNADVSQHDAKAIHQNDVIKKLVSTDPPYYDLIPFADLSDFFYVWLRSALVSIYPDICSTLLVPKAQELLADHFRHGSKEKAKDFFENSLIKVFQRVNKINHHNYPLTVYYALKQTETDQDDNVSSTGWETILEGLIQSNFSICGTWPLRTELSNRMRGQDSNALASSILLVCRPRPEYAPKTTRRQFLSELKRDLPQALKLLQQGNIAPVDFAQASIGPGMAIYSKYTAILESDGNPMRVRTALQLINQILDEFLTEQEGEFDTDTRWTLTWFEQHQFNDGLYGDAETLSKAKNTSIQGLVEAGILQAKAGKVRLLPRDELKPNWQPQKDKRISIWEITQYLIHTLDKNGETAAAELLAQIGQHERSLARDLAYRLYSLCDRKSWTTEAIAYNSLVISWPEILRLANSITPEQTDTQLTLI
jgi:putative DNA methylase